jgi:hypothetical protein
VGKGYLLAETNLQAVQIDLLAGLLDIGIWESWAFPGVEAGAMIAATSSGESLEFRTNSIRPVLNNIFLTGTLQDGLMTAKGAFQMGRRGYVGLE